MQVAVATKVCGSPYVSAPGPVGTSVNVRSATSNVLVNEKTPGSVVSVTVCSASRRHRGRVAVPNSTTVHSAPDRQEGEAPEPPPIREKVDG